MGLLKGLLIVPLLWANPMLSAETPQRQPQVDLELEEILVKGRKPANTPEQLSAWLSRLVGQFRYEGYVERRGTENAMNRAEIQGGSHCANLGAPGLVQCQMNVSWQELPRAGGAEVPGGVSWLTPAVAVYGLYVGPPRPDQAPDSQYIGHMQVDSRGLAEIGMGELFDETLIYKSSCADLPGNCLRVVQIEAPRDGKVIRMNVEVQRDAKLEVRYVFQWHRAPQTLAASDNLEPTTATRAGNSIMPAALHSWAGKLVGKFRFVGYAPETLTQQRCADFSSIEQWEMRSLRIRCDTVSSDQECLGIGSGPGVRCIRDMGWQETSVPASRFQAEFDLWGYDPVAQRMVAANAWPAGQAAIRNLGGMMFATGTLGGVLKDTLTLTGLCPRDSVYNSAQMRIIIPPDGSRVRHLAKLKGRFIQMQELTRVGSESAEIPAAAPKMRNPSPRRP